MARRRRFLTRTGSQFLRGQRFDLTRKGYRKRSDEEIPQVVLPDGSVLNKPESIIYRALVGMKVPFQAQASLGGGNVLGGAKVDFLIYNPPIALEFQGPFHDTAEGQVRDFYRRVAREQAGYRPEYVYDSDMKRIHQRLREILGWG